MSDRERRRFAVPLVRGEAGGIDSALLDPANPVGVRLGGRSGGSREAAAVVDGREGVDPLEKGRKAVSRWKAGKSQAIISVAGAAGRSCATRQGLHLPLAMWLNRSSAAPSDPPGQVSVVPGERHMARACTSYGLQYGHSAGSARSLGETTGRVSRCSQAGQPSISARRRATSVPHQRHGMPN